MMTTTKATKLQTCRPKTSEHRRGMRWFTSLTTLLENDLATTSTILSDDRMSLQHTVQLYGVFVETGDARYLNLCEDFLQHTLKCTPKASSPAG